jgi:hypothetical protein
VVLTTLPILAPRLRMSSAIPLLPLLALGGLLQGDLYLEILRRLRVAVRRIRPEKLRIKSWFPLHDNAPAHRSVLVKDFLAKNKVTTLEHSPYSFDPTAADFFYLFLRLKSTLKGQRFCAAADIIRNATEQLVKAFTE